MAKVQLINQKGEKLKDITLADSVWNIETNDIVLKKAIDLQKDLCYTILVKKLYVYLLTFKEK